MTEPAHLTGPRYSLPGSGLMGIQSFSEYSQNGRYIPMMKGMGMKRTTRGEDGSSITARIANDHGTAMARTAVSWFLRMRNSIKLTISIRKKRPMKNSTSNAGAMDVITTIGCTVPQVPCGNNKIRMENSPTW